MLNYTGLRKRTSYDGLVDYLELHQEIIKYPNRKATRIIDNGLGDIFEAYEQNKRLGGNIIIDIPYGNQSTQTDFERNNGVQVNLNIYKEEYQAKLALGTWHLGRRSQKLYKLEGKTKQNDANSNDVFRSK